jgi:RNA polymerase sigma-70 factor, ECF subfamily
MPVKRMVFDLSRQIGSIDSMTHEPRPVSATMIVDSSALTSDQLIVSLAQTKCRSHYAELFRRFAPKIKAFVMGQGLGAQEAEELAQETMLKVWRKSEGFDPTKATASTWIYTIARNLRIDMARKSARKRDLPEDLWVNESRPVDDLISLGQSADALKELLGGLPNEQKEVLNLSFYEDMSHAEVAKALNLPLGTVKSRLRLALGRLRHAFSQNGKC